MVKRQAGFTIIETVFVVIAIGVFLFIIFLAVPTAQRNSRNNGIRSDAAAVQSAIKTFESNNDGAWPTPGSMTGPNLKMAGDPGTQSNDFTIGADSTMDIYDGVANSGLCTAFVSGLDRISVNLGCKCNAAGNSSLPSTKKIAVLYTVETSSVTQVQCLDV